MGANFAYYTNQGTKKPINEDALVIRTANTVRGPLIMAAVCDGVGGMDRGDHASSITVHALSDWFDEKLPLYLRDGYDFGMLRSGAEFALRQISKSLAQQSNRFGSSMGTTVTMLIVFEGHCVTVNVGDSRTYEISDTIRQLTKDHSLVQREIDQGRLARTAAEKDQRRNVLLQCLGGMTDLAPDIHEWPEMPGIIYLLCSDGFRHELSQEELQVQLTAHAEREERTMYHTLESMAKQCMERGERDNITAVVIWTD